MFINCPYCRALVATDLATDLPPMQCPQCKGPLRNETAPSASTSGSTSRMSADSSRNDAHATATQDAHAPPPDVITQTIDDDPNTIFSGASEFSASESIALPPPATGDTEKPPIEAMPTEFVAPRIEAEYEDARADSTAARDKVSIEEDASTSAIADIGTNDLNADDAVLENAAIDNAVVEDLVVEHPVVENPVVDDGTPGDDGAPIATAAPAQRQTRRRAGQITPSFARAGAQPNPTSHARAWPVIAAIVGLIGLLTVQMLVADRARLASNARWRPLLETMCGVLQCDLPPWREPAAFALVQRDVRQHPTVPGVLRVSASFRNDARWSQPWPTLRLSLSDVNGRTAGERRFEAREYLGGAPAQSMLVSGETATIAMDIVEPAAQIVAYDFSFD